MARKFEEEIYDLINQSPQSWLEQAELLKISAEAILSAFNEVSRARYLPNRREKNLAFFQSFLMLMGLSFENLIKGVNIAQTPELSAKERLKFWKSHRGGHGIVGLAKDVTNLSSEEEHLLRRLEEYSVWAGRYPTATNMDQFVKSFQPESLHTYTPTDEYLWNALFLRLSQILKAEVENKR